MMSDVQMAQERRTLDEALKQANATYDVGEQLGKAFEDIKGLCDDIASLRDRVSFLENQVTAAQADLATHTADISSLKIERRIMNDIKGSLEHTLGDVRRIHSALQSRGIM